MKPINNISDLLETVNFLYKLLDGNFDFDSEGWPIFQREHFLNEWPETVVAYDNRKSKLITSKEKTLLCHFAGDIQNYRRFSKLMFDIPVYQQYLGSVFPDITVTQDMDIELQELSLLANQLFAAVLAINNIKLVFNTRCGSELTQKCFRHIPRNVVCASGFLGCPTTSNFYEVSEYTNKILHLLPSKLIIYGKQDLSVSKQLDLLGINYRYFDDFHRYSKRRAS